MNRRRLLVTASTAGLAWGTGCLDAFDDDGYPTQSFDGETVPLAPLADVYEWWESDGAAFVDARGQSQYDASHVPGAVLVPVGSERADELVDEWASDTRIVTYCDCPHTLAVQRASELIANGFESVYALDDGFPAWREAGHPTESNDPDAELSTYEIDGQADPRHAGEYVHVSTANGGNYEVARIESDGSYVTEVRFPDLTGESVLVVDAPGYTREGTLAEFLETGITRE